MSDNREQREWGGTGCLLDCFNYLSKYYITYPTTKTLLLIRQNQLSKQKKIGVMDWWGMPCGKNVILLRELIPVKGESGHSTTSPSRLLFSSLAQLALHQFHFLCSLNK